MAYVLFYPDMPQASSKVYHLLNDLGLKATSDYRTDVVAAFYWSYHKRQGKIAHVDLLRGLAARHGLRVFNLGGPMVTLKSVLHNAHETAFGYSARIRPHEHHGVVLEKANAQSTKRLRLVDTPRPARPGFVYERLIDNRIAGGRFGHQCRDIRVPYFNGLIPVLWTKDKPPHQPFSTKQIQCKLWEVGQLLQDDEITRIVSLLRLLQIEYAELDCLRDAAGRLYCVDVNNVPGTMRGSGTLTPAERTRLKRRYEAAFTHLIQTTVPT